MTLEQFLQYSAGSLSIPFDGMNASEIEIRLLELRSYADRLFEASHCLVAMLRAQIEDAEVVQRLRINGTSFNARCRDSNARAVSSFCA